jgi:glucan phosphoethanolaminetransferase (alkaline phosphatase superfamily)
MISFLKIVACVSLNLYHSYSFYPRLLEGYYLKIFPYSLFYITSLLILYLLVLFATLAVAFHPNKYARVFGSIVFFLTLTCANISEFIVGFLDYSIVEGMFAFSELNDFALTRSYSKVLPAFLYMKVLFLFCVCSLFVVPPVKTIRRLLVNLSFWGCFSILGFMSFFLGANSIRGLPSHFTMSVWLTHVGISNLFANNDHKQPDIKHIIQKDKTNIILLVDESVRGDYLDINNNKGLTPSLFKNKNKIINFGIASSGANDSARSNQILRTGPKKDNYKNDLYSNPFIWSYMKKSGYKVVFINAQYDSPFINGMTADEYKDVDLFYYPKSSNKDIESLDFIQKLLADQSDQPLFIYVVKYGVHYPYSYPKGKSKYLVENLSYDKITKKDLVNHYKNAIVANIDPFFERLFKLSAKNSVFIYTSDHGQNLLDNGLLISHGSTENTVAGEGTVPLFVWTESSEWKNKFQNYLYYNKDRTSHFNIFSTVLTIAGYDKLEVKKKHGNSLFDKINEPQTFATKCCLLPRKLGRTPDPVWVEIENRRIYSNYRE